ncbi:MAG: precorrin-3B C(17)-methyltransferase, partial [Pseudomonadota bacterium]
MHLAIIILSESALPTATKIQSAVGGQVHGLVRRVATDVPFDDTKAHVENLFSEGRPIIGVMASGTLIRLLAPVLGDKRSEPPVIAVADDGSAVVPLLGGHHGANDLARQIGEALNVQAAITTAGDVKFGIALDAPPDGYTLGNP